MNRVKENKDFSDGKLGDTSMCSLDKRVQKVETDIAKSDAAYPKSSVQNLTQAARPSFLRKAIMGTVIFFSALISPPALARPSHLITPATASSLVSSGQIPSGNRGVSNGQ